MLYYLAYGSNMAGKRLLQRIRSAEKLGVVKLPGHRLTFDNISTEDGSAKCDALLTDDPADQVIAVLYRMAAADKPKLDFYEGLGVEYRDAMVSIRLPDGKTAEALIYYGTNLNPGQHPYHWYKEHVVRGALENGLPQEYIAGIRAVESIDDPDPERTAREFGVHN